MLSLFVLIDLYYVLTPYVLTLACINRFSIFLTGAITRTVSVGYSWTVLDLADHVMLPGIMYMVYDGKILMDGSRLLRHLGIGKDCSIDIRGRLQGGMQVRRMCFR